MLSTLLGGLTGVRIELYDFFELDVFVSVIYLAKLVSGNFSPNLVHGGGEAF